MKPHSTKRKRSLTRRLQGRLNTTILQRRRETLYRMLFKQNDGKVPCFCCGEHVKKKHATIEHIIPRSKGGTDEMSNLSISHGYCNNKRGNTLPEPPSE